MSNETTVVFSRKVFVSIAVDGASPTSPPMFVVKHDPTPEEAANAVEYYVPVLERYFMTDRKC